MGGRYCSRNPIQSISPQVLFKRILWHAEIKRPILRINAENLEIGSFLEELKAGKAASTRSGGKSSEDLGGEGEFRGLLCGKSGVGHKVIETNTNPAGGRSTSYSLG